MGALLPDPYLLSIVTATAALVDKMLRPRAEPGAVLTATRFGFWPRCFVKAAAHAFI